MRKLQSSDWQYIISENLCKANYIVFDTYSVPSNIISQSKIFEGQTEKFICNNRLAVLSAFPFFIVDYFGINATYSF